jgi:hypothetical protein
VKVFEDFLSEAEYAQERGVGVASLRRDRRRRVGAPWVKDGRKIRYHIPSVREFHLRQQQRPRQK